MPTIDYATFCYWKDAPRLHQPGHLQKLVAAHGHQFDRVILVHQRIEDKSQLRVIDEIPNLSITDSYYALLNKFNIPPDDDVASLCSTGPTSPHWWPHHVINHLAALLASTADYIVFADSDIDIIRNEAPGWVAKAVEILDHNADVLVVSPSDGGHETWKRHRDGRFTMHMSQQIFMARRQQLADMDWNVWWDWPQGADWPDKSRDGHPNGYLAPQQPFREFYPMAEGRIWRYMNKMGLYRFVLDERWRYWHDGAANK